MTRETRENAWSKESVEINSLEEWEDKDIMTFATQKDILELLTIKGNYNSREII